MAVRADVSMAVAIAREISNDLPHHLGLRPIKFELSPQMQSTAAVDNQQHVEDLLAPVKAGIGPDRSVRQPQFS